MTPSRATDRPPVIIVGSINSDLVVTVDHLPGPGETVAGGTFERHGGGKGANQAVAAARAGARVRFVGAVGRDDLGELALRELAEEGIDVGAVTRRPDAPTGVAAIVVARDGENQIAVASGANSTLDAEAVSAALDGIGLPSSGVCMLSLEIPDGGVLAAARAAAAAGLRTIVNPAPARPLEDTVLDLGPILTPNAVEASMLAGHDAAEDAARALSARTGAPVIVTLGAEGALLVDGERRERFDAERVEAVDATGAGDAFNGALAAALADGVGLDEAVRHAVAAATRSVQRRGARA